MTTHSTRCSPVRWNNPFFFAALLLCVSVLSFFSSAQPQPVRFAVIGDYGLAGTNAQVVADMVKSWEPDFIITTGDNNYPLGAAFTIDANVGQYYHDFIYPYQGTYGDGADENRFFPALGNHDGYLVNAQGYLDYFTLPGNERYYDFVSDPVHFFVLNSDYNEPDGFRSDSIQAQWLQQALTESDSPWNIVYLHTPPYSSGHHGSNQVMQWDFADWGADAVIAGHDHDYERLVVDGIPYFVNGLGGSAIYAFDKILEESQFRYNRNYGAMLVTATDEQITFEFYSVGDPEMPIDSFTIYAG